MHSGRHPCRAELKQWSPTGTARGFPPSLKLRRDKSAKTGKSSKRSHGRQWTNTAHKILLFIPEAKKPFAMNASQGHREKAVNGKKGNLSF